MENKFDFIIIGAGIIGSMIARELSKYEVSILLIEKEMDICMGSTAANSGIIHAGYDPVPGTLKSEMNIIGNKLWDNVASELHIPMKKVGSLVVAVGKEEAKKIEELYERGKKNSVPSLKILSRDEVLDIQPLLNKDTYCALYSPTAGVIDPFKANFAVCENAVMNGVKLMLDTCFIDFIKQDKNILGIKTNKGDFYSKYVINCAGVYSDEVMHKAGIREDFKITPKKGEYFVFDAQEITIKQIIFPVPSEKSKGILVSTTTHGNLMIGPNINQIEDKLDTDTTIEGLEQVFNGALKLLPSLKKKDVIAQFAGIRATGNAKTSREGVNYSSDFIIEIPDEVNGFINLGGIDSPGLASSPAIAQRVVDLLKEKGFELKNKKEWNPIRIPGPVFRELSHDERKILIKRNPLYGNVVCRCELVTEGEIVEEIHSPVPALTYNSIKRRTWLGTGRCQGSFDYPKVLEILSRELDIPIEKVAKRGVGSEFIFRKTKEF